MDQIYFKCKNNIKIFKHNIQIAFDKEQKKILKKNEKFKDRHRGKRCFIVGNGPSLKKQDLSKLREEYVFSVNMLPKSSLYAELKTNYHVMMDPFIFQINEEREVDREKLEIIRKINTENNTPTVFVPYLNKQVIENLKLDEELDLAYLHFGGDMYDNFKRKIDLSKCITGFSNVVQYAIIIAIYMGFEEIYLLGCDMTVYEQISAIYGKNVELHAYEMNENEKKAIHDTHKQVDVESFFCGFCHTLSDYRRLYDYANLKDIKLYNATAGGILETLPRVDYNTLF